MQQTFMVLQTLRSSECSTASASTVGVGLFGCDDPRSPGAVQAHRHAVLAGHRAELGDCATRAAGDGERKPGVGEKRPPGGVSRGVDELHRTLRQARRSECRRYSICA